MTEQTGCCGAATAHLIHELPMTDTGQRSHEVDIYCWCDPLIVDGVVKHVAQQ